jgi:DNA-binding response OmpR family regulator
MTRICPHCGYDLERDELIERDGFRLDPRGTTDFNGHPVQLTKAQSIFFASVAKEAPRALSYVALIERMGIEGADERNVLAVQFSHIRTRLRAFDIPLPIVSVRSVGYQWRGA